VDRRIWVYPPKNYEIMRQFFVLRASLVPYIYSSARQTYDEGLSLLRPLYYLFPEASEAYSYDLQYMFGPDLLVAPVTQPVDPTTLMVSKEIWIPEGTYISWFSGERLTGPMSVTRTFTLAEMPVYAKEGSIIPMRTDDFSPLGSAQEIPTKMKFMVFVGECSSGQSWLYEDDGHTTDYMRGKTANTSITFTMDAIRYAVLLHLYCWVMMCSFSCQLTR
jgi:alpha-glucosidase